jgi:dolichol kinase
MVTQVFTIVDYLGIFATIILFGNYFFRTLKYRPLKDHLNEIFVLVGFTFSASNVFWYLYIMRSSGDRFADLFGWLIYGPILAMFALVFIFTGIATASGHIETINKNRDRDYTNKMNCVENHADLKHDLFRKIFHILYFGIILGVCFIVAVLAKAGNFDHQTYLEIFWGIRPNSKLFFLEMYQNPQIYPQFGILPIAVFFIFYIGTIISVILDMLRFSNVFYSLGRNLLIKLARKGELCGIPSFVPIFVGVMPMALIFPPIPVFAIMISVIFADTAASQIGIRFGKHKLPWNRKKSWEGLIAGCMVALLAWIFVGPVWALGAMLGFFLGDALTEKPLPVMDNLFTPIITGIIFILLTLAGISYQVPGWL